MKKRNRRGIINSICGLVLIFSACSKMENIITVDEYLFNKGFLNPYSLPFVERNGDQGKPMNFICDTMYFESGSTKQITCKDEHWDRDIFYIFGEKCKCVKEIASFRFDKPDGLYFENYTDRLLTKLYYSDDVLYELEKTPITSNIKLSPLALFYLKENKDSLLIELKLPVDNAVTYMKVKLEVEDDEGIDIMNKNFVLTDGITSSLKLKLKKRCVYKIKLHNYGKAVNYEVDIPKYLEYNVDAT